MDNRYFDGVLGLAFPRLSHTGTTPLAQLGAQAGVHAFTVLIESEGQDSRIIFGEPGHQIREGLVYAPVVQQEWWTLEGSIAIGSTSLCDRSYLALDTGTSYILLPSTYFRALMRQLLPPEQLDECRQSGLGQWGCPCDFRHSAQVVYILVGESRFPLFPEDLFREVTGVLGADGAAWCDLEVQPGSGALPLILGDTFLRTVVAHFDAGNASVGLKSRADHRPPSQHARALLEADAGRPRTAPLLPPHVVSSWAVRWPAWELLLASAACGGLLGLLAAPLLLRLPACCERCRSRRAPAGPGLAPLLPPA
ncbi:unnamed protein product [Prorocentrum cordatum]|nr:unnamed protein product [Polarella glacialis]